MSHHISAPTSRFSSIRVRQAFIGKKCVFTSQLLVKICQLKQLTFYLALWKIPENSSSEAKVWAINSVFAQEINQFHIAESEKFYRSSKSSESWLEKLRATKLMIRWGLTCACNGMLNRLFNPHVRWKWHRGNYGNAEDSLDSLLSVSKSLATSYPPSPQKKIASTLLSENFRFPLLIQ